MKNSAILKIALRLIAALWIIFFSFKSSAAVISFSSSVNENNRWTYGYTIAASISDPRIDEFTIYFSPSLYTNLSIEAAPSGWDSLVIQPDVSIPSDGFFDGLALNTGITPGTSQGRFAVSFTFLGEGFPTTQRFDIIDPISFATISTGFTSAVTTPPPPSSDIPEPNTITLTSLAIAALFLSRKYFKKNA